MRQTGPAELGCDHHRRHRVAHLHQVWVGHHHQAPAQAHCSLVGALSGYFALCKIKHFRWVLGAALLLVYTVVKFYLLKPNHVPQPEKEHIRVGSPLGSATGAHFIAFVKSCELMSFNLYSLQQGHQYTTEILRV